MNDANIVISCFDLTGNMVMPWAEAGFTCYCVDMQHPAGESREGNIFRVGADMRDWLPPFRPIAFAAFFPPCTDVAVSGARWFRDKGSSPYACSMPPSASRNGRTRHTSSKTPSPPSQPIGANPISPSIPAITRGIRAVKTTSTPRKPACGQAAASSCRRPDDLNRNREAGCTCCRLPRSGRTFVAPRRWALPAPSLRRTARIGGSHENARFPANNSGYGQSVRAACHRASRRLPLSYGRFPAEPRGIGTDRAGRRFHPCSCGLGHG